MPLPLPFTYLHAFAKRIILFYVLLDENDGGIGVVLELSPIVLARLGEIKRI